MAESSLQDRLREHEKAFDGLLSLIPAKMYYGEGDDPTDQWRRKKQTKAQAAEAKRNKLDPDSELNRSVKEIMDEEARKKRKRDEKGDDEDEWSDVDGIEAEQPGQGLKKKQKMVEAEPELTEKERRKEEKKQGKKDRKAERKILREEEAAYLKRNVKSGVNKVKLGPREPRTEYSVPNTPSKPNETTEHNESIEDDHADETEASGASEAAQEELDVSGLAANEEDDQSEKGSTSTSEPDSPIFDTNGTPADSTGQAPSSITSTSSAAPTSEKPKKSQADTEAIRARFAAKLQEMRAARKADGPDGKPIRTRQELIESRRQKQAERKAHKKELRNKAKEEEDRKREEALASARNSPMSILSPSVESADNNFAFGRVSFGDGAQLSHDLSHVLNSGQKKGPSDPKTALQKLQNEKKRLQTMDEEKRKDIQDKETWLTARKRAEGERVRDDEKLLKKALKRKETQKKKSEKAWQERAEGIQKSMHQRQQKREANIKQRKEQKAAGKAGKKNKGGAKKKSRAGFEGAFSVGGKRK